MAKKQFIIDDLNRDAVSSLLKTEVSNSPILQNIVIWEQFAGFIPPLTEEEEAQLSQNILAEGVRDALIVWENPQQKGQYILIDGHNRYRICQKYGLSFPLKEMSFASVLEAQNWMIANQLGKRNLTELQKAYLRGKQYQREKSTHGGDRKSRGQNDPLILEEPNDLSKSRGQNDPLKNMEKTAEKLALQHRVSEKTIKRDEKYAEQIDQLVGNDDELKWKILSKEIDVPKSALAQLSQQEQTDWPKVRKALKEGQSWSSLADFFMEVVKEATPATDDWRALQKQIMAHLRDAFKSKDPKMIDQVIALLKEARRKI
ncbi:MAG: ParB N-terminal domain-containing protein [Microscillaceae bacterium]|nr:ParB N-terminal domain-containing protein [Microscillaceae bacterium]